MTFPLQTVEKVGQPQASHNFYHINFKEFLIQKQTAIKSDIGLYQLPNPEISGFLLASVRHAL